MKALKINNLNLNDRVNYWIKPKGFVPKPGSFRQRFAESSSRDGKQLLATQQTVDCDVLSFWIRVKGSSKADLKAKLDAIWREVQKPEPIISWTQEGDTIKYWTAIQAPTVDPSNYFDWDYLDPCVCDVSWEMEAQPRPYRARTSLTVLENLVPNGGFEQWDSGAPVGWVKTVSGSSTISQQGASGGITVWEDKSCAKLHLVSSSDDCYLTTEEYILIDPTKHCFADVFVRANGSPTAKLIILCYDDEDNYLDDITFDVSGISTAYFHSLIWLEWLMGDVQTFGVIAPNGSGTNADWPANTSKSKLRLQITGNPITFQDLWFDAIQLRCSEFIAGHKALNPVAVNIPPGEYNGTAPAMMDLILKNVYHAPFAYLVGQGKYHPDFDTVKEIESYSSPGFDPTCSEGYCQVFDVQPNLVTNGNMSSYSGSGNSTNWLNWTETRSGNAGITMQANPQSNDAGNGCVEVYCENDSNKCPNSGFESGSSQPDNWQYTGSGGSVYAERYTGAPGMVHSGISVLRAIAQSVVTPGHYIEYVTSNYISVDVAEKYNMSCWFAYFLPQGILGGDLTASNCMPVFLYLDCYDVASNPTGTLTIYSGKPISSPFRWHWQCPSGDIQPAYWPVGTVKVKPRIKVIADTTAVAGMQVYFDDICLRQVSYNFDEQIESDFVAIDDEKDYLVSWATKAGFAASRYIPSYLHIDFCDATPTLLESRQLWCVNPGTAWESYRKIFESTDLPAGVTQAKLRAVRLGRCETQPGKIVPSHLWDSFIIREEPMLAEAEFDVDPHVGRYLLAANITIESGGDPIDGTLSVQVAIVDKDLGDITEMVEVGRIDIGDPQGAWVNTGLLEESLLIDIPTPKLPDAANTSNLKMKIRFTASYDFNDVLNYLFDFVALIPADGAIAKIAGLTDEQFLILDCSSRKRSLLTSLDGTVDTATKSKALCVSNYQLQVDPIDGTSLVILALYNNDGSYDVRPVYDVEIQYSPRDFI